MTDPAPPARTTLTPEEIADLRRRSEGADTSECFSANMETGAIYPETHPRYLTVKPSQVRRLLDAVEQAFSEGRLAGLREAAGFVEGRFWVPNVSPQFIAERIRSLAEDVPKAPKTQADQADPDPL